MSVSPARLSRPARAVAWLGGGRWPGARLVLLAGVLTLPALAVDHQYDDFMILGAVTGGPVLDGAARAFVFTAGEDAERAALRASGALPWWAAADAQVAFFRPVSGLSFALDTRLLSAHPVATHLHSWLLFLALLVAVGALYRQVHGGAAVGALAFTLYALDDAHGHAVGWLANRYGLCVALPATLFLWLHLDWRRTKSGLSLLGALGCLALSLGAGEAGVSVLAYAAAWALFVEEGSFGRRAFGLAPALVVVAAYRVLYRSLGFGAAGTSYIDPLGEPLGFALATLERLPVLLLGQMGYPPAEGYALTHGGWALLWWACAVGALVVVGVAAWPVVRAHRTAAFWAAGMVLSAVPACGGLPANRLLLIPGIGGAGLLAALIAPFLAGDRRPLVAVLAAVHLAVAPVALPIAAYGPQLSGLPRGAWDRVAEVAPGDVVVVLWAPSFFHPYYALYAERGRPGGAGVPPFFYPGGGPGAVVVDRVDVRTFEVTAPDGFVRGYEEVFRGRSRPFSVGERVRVAKGEVEVLDVGTGGRPRRLRFVADEGAALRFVSWRDGGFVDERAPGVGERWARTPALADLLP